MVTEATPTVEEAMAALGHWAKELTAITRVLQAEVDGRRRSREQEEQGDGPPTH